MKRILGWIKPNPKVLSIQQLELPANGQLNPRRHRRCNPVYEGSWVPPGRNRSSFLDAPPRARARWFLHFYLFLRFSRVILHNLAWSRKLGKLACPIAFLFPNSLLIYCQQGYILQKCNTSNWSCPPMISSTLALIEDVTQSLRGHGQLGTSR